MGQRVAPLYNNCSGIADNGKSWGAGLPLRENNISKSSAPAGGVEHMAPPCSNIAIALRQAGPPREWKDGSTTLLHAGSQPGALPRASDGPNADKVGEELEQATTGATSGTLSTATSTPRAHPSPLSLPVAEAVPTGEEEGIQDSQREESPLGFMFRPELHKASVVAVVSEILCRPGFTVGPDDERRLKRSVESGRIDVHNMSRLLRWLAGRRAARELSERGIEFVVPRAQPYTSGQGMTRLMEEVSFTSDGLFLEQAYVVEEFFFPTDSPYRVPEHSSEERHRASLVCDLFLHVCVCLLWACTKLTGCLPRKRGGVLCAPPCLF